jgi:hypothetical protein
MSGLGLSGFLKHTNDSGGRGQWLREWKKSGSGEVTIWLHTRAPIVPSFTHSFMLEDEYTNKETSEQVKVLRYPRFVSPDPEIVHRNQYFRDEDTKVMKTLPDRDPFLLLREWLRLADHLSLEQPIFRWENPKERKIIVWERGELSGLVKRGRNNAYNSLDTKIEYVYVVVDNDNPDKGPVLDREGKLASQRLSEVVRQQQKLHGDVQGDPLQHPYAIVLAFDSKARSPMDSYKAFKAETAELTDEIWGHLSSDEFPDPLPLGEPGDGDMQKIRDAFEVAAQVELPLDQIFSDDAQVRRELIARKQSRAVPRQSMAAQSRAAAPPAGTGTAAKPPLPARQPPPQTQAAVPPQTPGGGPQMRRKKVAPPPPVEPQVETIPCDDCGTPMLVTDTKCAKCGAEYEPIGDDTTPTLPPKPSPALTAVGRPKPSTVAAKPPAQPPPPAEKDAAVDPANCWACGVFLADQSVCPSCGIDQDDDIPF